MGASSDSGLGSNNAENPYFGCQTLNLKTLNPKLERAAGAVDASGE